MENKSHALAAGAFVLAVAALLIGLAVWLMRDVTNTTAYEMVTDDAVSGLQPQAVVRFKGVAVGKVTSISATALTIDEPGYPPVVKTLESPLEDMERELSAVQEF